MASSIRSQAEQCLCSICQDFFSDPVTIPCGHNFCMECITQHWDSSMCTQCPLCKKDFHLRPDLGINREFRELIEGLKRGESPFQPGAVPCDVMEQKQTAAETQAEELIKELEQEITELERRNTELEQLSHTEDHLHLLQIYPSLCSPLDTKIWAGISTDTHLKEDAVRRALTKHQEFLSSAMVKVTGTVNVTMDPETAHPKISLSEDDKQAGYGETRQIVPDSPWRFDTCPSILGKEGFSSGKFYFEVQVKGKTEWDLGVARESVNRKGIITLSPRNGLWTLWLRNGSDYKACDCLSVSLCLKAKPQKVGVYVDYEEGLVSFYDVESRSHIYSFTGQAFTEKLYPYFSPGFNHGDKNSAPLIISPVGKNTCILANYNHL
uniref:Si:ch211-216p19.6 n=1 Tax=Cyprinus carpio TaxID=7962 RepID=A0A8C2DVX4_CYPCA